MSKSSYTAHEQAAFQWPAPDAADRSPSVGVQSADTPVQPTDTPAQSTADGPSADADLSRAVLSSTVGAVGASFLRVRPWIVAGPAIGVAVVLVGSGAPPTRLALAAAIQISMLSFFIWEAVQLARAADQAGARAFVSPRRLEWSLAITVTGLGLATAVTGGARSPMLPMLLAPTGVAFAAFGARPVGRRFLAYLAGWLLALAAFAEIDPWPPMPAAITGALGLAAVALAGVLLWFGVAALSSAHAAAAEDIDDLRRVALREAALRARDLEAIGTKVAHELKNPLAAVIALSQLRARTSTPGPQTEQDEVIARELARMGATLDAYLSHARPLDDLRWQSADAGQIAQEVVAAVEGRAHVAGVALRCEGMQEVGAGPRILVDPSRLTDALLNVVSNALDATPREGEVRLALVRDDRWLAYIVEDTGPGMDAETLERLGTPYFTTRDGGTGLGVVLARTVARQHGGELLYESRPGRGTRATLKVRVRPGAGV